MSQPPATTPAGSEPTGSESWERPAGDEGAADPYASDPYASNPYAAYAEADDASMWTSSSPSRSASSSDYGYGDSDPLAAPSTDGSEAAVDDPSGPSAADPYSTVPSSPYAVQEPYAPQQAHAGQPGYGYAPARPQSGVALASMITGFCALVLGGMCAVPILAAPVAIVLAIMGMRETGPGQKDGRGFAIAGLVSGIIGTILIVGVVLLYGGMIIAMLATATQS